MMNLILSYNVISISFPPSFSIDFTSITFRSHVSQVSQVSDAVSLDSSFYQSSQRQLSLHQAI